MILGGMFRRQLLVFCSLLFLCSNAQSQQDDDSKLLDSYLNNINSNEKTTGQVSTSPDSKITGTTDDEPLKYQQQDFKASVLLQGINKITATVSSFNLKKNAKKNFGTLEIQLIKCWKAPAEQEPENKALLRISEQVTDEDKKEIFFGWMFSSSQALSALEHPVYDIAVKECL